MSDPPSPTVGPVVDAADTEQVVAADEQSAVDVDVDRWSKLAAKVLSAEGCTGELTLTFIDRDDIAALNAEYLGKDGPTDVLSFPLDVASDDDDDVGIPGTPVLLGDVVICPEVAAAQAPTHAGTLDDELALLVVHGVLHVLGHDHADAAETTLMRATELDYLESFHWDGPPPPAFRQEQQ